MVRISREEMFRQLTETIAKRSACLRKQVGAIIVKDGRLVSMGYNGPPSGVPHCKECKGEGCSISIHAEMNAIAFAAKEGVTIKGSTMYCSMSPCINCAKVIINSGIERVVYLEEYRSMKGVDLLFNNGVRVERFGIEELKLGLGPSETRELIERLTIQLDSSRHLRRAISDIQQCDVAVYPQLGK